MKPLIVLITTFFISLLITKFIKGDFRIVKSGRIAMAVMLVFTAIGHFAFTEGMAMMLPEIIPFKIAVVYCTGIVEIIAAIGLLIPQFRVITGWGLILFFILILPANIHASLNNIDYQNGTSNGFGIDYLLFRIPLQILFIVWVYYSAIKPKIRS